MGSQGALIYHLGIALTFESPGGRCLKLTLTMGLLLGLSIHAYAGAHEYLESRSLEQAFEQLKDKPVDYTNTGSVCEELALLEFQDMFPDHRYQLFKGLIYTNGSRVLGGLDLVVFDMDRDDEGANLVGEVKCSRSVSSALSKAHEQLSRFKRYIDQGGYLEIYQATNPSRFFDVERFQGIAHLATVSFQGTVARGFDYQIPFDLAATQKLRNRLLDCQNRGECPRPFAVDPALQNL